MRKFLAISFASLALFVSVASISPAVAHAVTSATDNTGAQTAKTQEANPPTLGVFAGVMTFIMGIFAWLVGVAAITLDNAVYYTVVTMGNYVKNLTAVGVAWRILRDVGNIALIFGFLAIGISIILNTEKLGYGQKMLPTLLIVAVFMNFSLFITEAVIDAGNFVATEVYTQINGGNPAGKANFDLTTAGSTGIAGKLMNQLGLATIYSAAIKNGSLYQASNTSTIAFMSIILFIITAFVMFSLAFILIARFVTLIFLIILAPVGIVGFAVPQLASLGKQWRDKLVEQTITAPVLMLLLYVALLVITDKFFLGFGTIATGDWTGYVANGGVTDFTGFAGTILSFLVAMGLMLAVVISAKKLGAAGADLATKGAGKLTFGAVAFAGRRTIGRTSNYLARKVRSSGFGRSETGRLLAGGLDRGAKASFDIRGTKALGSLPYGGVDAGAAQKGGYAATEKASIKAREDYAKTLRLTKDEERKQEEVKKEKEEADEALKAAKAADDENSTTLTKAIREHAQGRVNEIKGREDEIKKTNKTAPQKGYAEKLESGVLGKLYKNSQAAKNIKKGPDKALEAMKKAFKQVSDDESKGEKKEEKTEEKKA